MMRTIDIGEGELSSEAGSVTLADLDRYSEVVARIIQPFKTLEGVAVGSVIKLDPVKITIRNEEFEYDPGSIKRIK
jgi:hypothetical protein